MLCCCVIVVVVSAVVVIIVVLVIGILMLQVIGDAIIISKRYKGNDCHDIYRSIDVWVTVLGFGKHQE